MKLPLTNRDLPAGYRLFGLRAGISAVSGKKDLALFVSDRPARAAGVFTRNVVQAAPVLYCREKLARSAAARAVVINSGNANACTGRRGADDVRRTVRLLSGGLGIEPGEILVASTGVIGRPLPRTALERGVREIARRASAGTTPSAEDAVRAIMTTDTRPKAARTTFRARGRRFTLWGCAKGSGMIHPNMATMLSVVLTDAGMPATALRPALAEAARTTFNRVTVDGDTSTNDSLFLLANGAAGAVSPSDRTGLENFRSALREVCLSLSAQVAADGEGATRTAWIFVRGARTEAEADRLASTVATSPLFKTALHGADPNWGRILAALGRAGVPFDPARVDVRLGGTRVCRGGGKAPYSEEAVHRALTKDRVTVTVDLHGGKAGSHYVTCDFSKNYVAINADYTT